MRSKSILSGIANVPIEPTANTDNRLTNNITISNVAYPGVKLEAKQVEEKTNPYKDIEKEQTIKSREANEVDSLDHYLLNLYQTILLSDNKKLLANMISKNQIILTKEDLEEIIKRKVGKKCIIEYEDPDTSCFGSNAVFLKIESIRVYEEGDTIGSDFTIKYNCDYLEMQQNYHLCFKMVLVN